MILIKGEKKVLKREKNKAFYTHEKKIIDEATGEILLATKETIVKAAPEPDFIKVYYETMMSFNQIHNIPVQFVLSLSRFIEWSNDGEPMMVTLSKWQKDELQKDCKVALAQINRYIKTSVDNGLLFKTHYRAVYEVNPFMIAKGKWDSIKQLQTQYDFVNGKWIKIVKYKIESAESEKV